MYSFYYKDVKNSDEASVLFWYWLLNQTRFTPKIAALHNIYQQDTAAVFYDLDDDKTREILGTHYSTAISGMGDCLLYILKFDKDKKSKYRLISDDLYFDINYKIEILSEENNGYKKIRVFSKTQSADRIFSYDKKKNMYVEKK